MKDRQNYGVEFSIFLKNVFLNRVKSFVAFTMVKFTFFFNFSDFELPKEEYASALNSHKMIIWNTLLRVLSSNMIEVQVIDRLRTRYLFCI